VVASAVLGVMTAGYGLNNCQAGPTFMERLRAAVEEMRTRTAS